MRVPITAFYFCFAFQKKKKIKKWDSPKSFNFL